MNMNNTPLILTYTEDELWREFINFQEAAGNTNMYSTHNRIVNYFQQDYMFRVERMLWEYPEIQNKLIANRLKYANGDITVSKILTGFKVSGIYKGYSGFNPLLFKFFCQKYNLRNKVVYDPCGGWGHRLLGGGLLRGYIYNDISTPIADNVKKIVNFFDIPGVTIYNQDCLSFVPSEHYDAIFTCPPYYNIESYENKPFVDMTEFCHFLDYIISLSNLCGIVMKESLMHRSDYTEKIILHKGKSHLNKEKSIECLYVFDKTNKI